MALEYKVTKPKPYTRFEKARIIGARALQLSMGAPPLIELDEKLVDSIEIAFREYEEDVIPITTKKIRSIGEIKR